MIDGLALGETTPGPLIMVVAFVGFVGGWTKAVFGSDALFLSGAAAATVVTFFTFLPSFFFIPARRALHRVDPRQTEIHRAADRHHRRRGRRHRQPRGVLRRHVLWPQGFGGRFEWPSALIGAAAGFALFRLKAGVIPVIAASAVAGWSGACWPAPEALAGSLRPGRRDGAPARRTGAAVAGACRLAETRCCGASALQRGTSKASAASVPLGRCAICGAKWCELRHLGVVADEHDARERIVQPAQHREQAARAAAVEALVAARSWPALQPKASARPLRRRQRPHRRAADDQLRAASCSVQRAASQASSRSPRGSSGR